MNSTAARRRVIVPRAGQAFDDAVAGLRQTLDTIAAAQHAQTEAISAVVQATQEALRLIDTRGQ